MVRPGLPRSPEGLVGAANGAKSPPRMPDGARAKKPAAVNAHSPGGGPSGLVQSAFRSPARSPAWVPTGKACAPRRQAKNALHCRWATFRSLQQSNRALIAAKRGTIAINIWSSETSRASRMIKWRNFCCKLY